jgi:hypothetical protein
LALGPVAELPLGNLLVAQKANLLVPLVADVGDDARDA